MKKRILSVALAAVLALSLTLAGCGSSDGGEKQGGNGKLVGVAMRRMMYRYSWRRLRR